MPQLLERCRSFSSEKALALRPECRTHHYYLMFSLSLRGHSQHKRDRIESEPINEELLEELFEEELQSVEPKG